MLAQPQSAAFNALVYSSMEPREKEDNIVIFENRFGNIQINMNNSILFPGGLLGMPECKEFCLAEFPEKKMAQFKLMQSLNNPEICFVVLPLALDNKLIARDDIIEAQNMLGIPEGNLAIALIASTSRAPGSVNVTVNVRAPLLIDTVKHTAAQFVFASNKYEVRYQLG